MRRGEVECGEVALPHDGFVMCLVRTGGTVREDVDVTLQKEEIHPVPDSLFGAPDGTVVDHLDAVVVADEDGVFHDDEGA